MARKLKTFTTSIGFFDLAIAAPSMKAALEAWGAGPAPKFPNYEAGTWGPAEADAFIERDGRQWHRP